MIDRRLLFVTGKGGVGKTTTAAAIARVAARQGKRVLACEMDGKGSLGRALGVGQVGFVPVSVDDRLSVMSMNTEDALREYVHIFAKMPRLPTLGPLAKAFDFIADAAPGVTEILAVGKLCHEVRERHYDLVVVDADASGHVVAQLAAPTHLARLVGGGLVRSQTDWMTGLLHDPAVTAAVVVATPEELPVTEGVELIARIGAETGVTVAAAVMNRVLASPLRSPDAEALETFDPLCAGLVHHAGVAGQHVIRAAQMMDARRRRASEQVARMHACSAGLTVMSLPEVAARRPGGQLPQVLVDHVESALQAEVS